MGFVINSLFAVAFLTIGLVEIRIGRGIIRRNVTRENDPLFYWTEVLVSFSLAGISAYFAMIELSKLL